MKMMDSEQFFFFFKQPTNGVVKAISTNMTSTQTLLEDLNPCFHSLFHFSITLDTDSN